MIKAYFNESSLFSILIFFMHLGGISVKNEPDSKGRGKGKGLTLATVSLT